MLTLNVKKRELKGKKVQILRKQEIIPAVVYGHGIKSESIEMPYLIFEKIFKQVGESDLLNLEIEGEKPRKVLITEIQYHPLSDKIEHVDFYQIKEGEKIHVEVELKLVGESPAVKELGGILFSNMTKLEIECLPDDLIHDIKIDISKLTKIDDAIRIKDLEIPASIKVKHNLEEMVVMVQPPHSEEELKELESKPVEKVEEVAKIEKAPKKEAEEVDEKKKK
ncbi:MAG: 50S ribosomal protein L25 [Patescibacteria group bacterium]|nr:50S ribosomal protein L25 [Patescibacteria group bacterium]MDD5164217.1 50S ribosomal protein L25 [Patescibacteria group bacterium]MDD5534635.1 50S ribosomal protein L25 [Patescibacteria group bacterium]